MSRIVRCDRDCGCVVTIGAPRMPATAGDRAGLTRVLRSFIVNLMLINDRDRHIVLSVSRFGQLATAHVSQMHFHDLSSTTPLKRSLARLVARNYLRPIERRTVGGSGAGSGQYVYQLGQAGWKLAGREGRYTPHRAVNYHTLGIADAYVELLTMEQAGLLEIEGFVTEPDNWVTIAGADLRPDLRIDVADPFRRRSVSLWLEIDLGNERPKAIKDKLMRYWHAYQNAGDELAVFPLIVFLVPDDPRAKELRWVIAQGAQEAQALFVVSTIPEFAPLLFA